MTIRVAARWKRYVLVWRAKRSLSPDDLCPALCVPLRLRRLENFRLGVPQRLLLLRLGWHRLPAPAARTARRDLLRLRLRLRHLLLQALDVRHVPVGQIVATTTETPAL